MPDWQPTRKAATAGKGCASPEAEGPEEPKTEAWDPMELDYKPVRCGIDVMLDAVASSACEADETVRPALLLPARMDGSADFLRLGTQDGRAKEEEDADACASDQTMLGAKRPREEAEDTKSDEAEGADKSDVLCEVDSESAGNEDDPTKLREVSRAAQSHCARSLPNGNVASLMAPLPRSLPERTSC